jgi:glutamine---fructose-6-phosphate transaminase (isomerizing)
VEHHQASGLDLTEAARRTFSQIQGAHGIVLVSADEPDKIVCARIGNAGGVVLGLGEGENFIASDIPAILEHTRRVIFLESGQMAVVTREGIRVETLEGEKVEAEIHAVAWDPVAAEKGEFRHFMQKEIHEQVRALTDTLAGRVDFDHGKIRLPELNLTPELAKRIQKIYITACGTAAYAGMVGKTLIETIARIPVEVVIGSEFRYSDPIVDENTVVLAISQSGETADTLAAMEEGRKKGATVWSIVNAIGSQAMRVADGFHLDADRAGNRGGLHQGLYRAAGQPVHAGDFAGRPARDAGRKNPPKTGGRPAPGARPGGPRDGPRGRGREGGLCAQGHPRLPVFGARHQHADCLRGRA